MKGWFVASGGGPVAIGLTEDGKIAVAAVRTRQVEFFHLDGAPAGPPMPFSNRYKVQANNYLGPADRIVDGVAFQTAVRTDNPGPHWNTVLLFPLGSPLLAWALILCGIVLGSGYPGGSRRPSRQSAG